MANEFSQDKAAKVKKGDELITALKVIMEDNSRIIAQNEEIKEMLQKALPKQTPM